MLPDFQLETFRFGGCVGPGSTSQLNVHSMNAYRTQQVNNTSNCGVASIVAEESRSRRKSRGWSATCSQLATLDRLVPPAAPLFRRPISPVSGFTNSVVKSSIFRLHRMLFIRRSLQQ